MADEAGLSVRRASCFGEDHEWNEVLIKGTWIVIDATRVGTAKDNGYNVSPKFMEKKVAGDRGTTEGNVSYVIAEYLNGTMCNSA
jgi:transglutaminase-like putative cysteine protease